MDVFHKWLKSIPDYKTITILEPFAGANNIVGMVKDVGYCTQAWRSYDLDPVNDDSNATDLVVEQRDTLSDYPAGFVAAITNPPYLAKNSATRRGLPFPATAYDDLYQVALATMLEGTPYVAAIVPESFVTQALFHDRLQAVVSLTCRMFEDTEVPVCLALFIPNCSKPTTGKLGGKDFAIYAENRLIGTYSKLMASLRQPRSSVAWRFNDSAGLIGLQAIDNQKAASINFTNGAAIPASSVKETSRSVTRISCAGLDETTATLVIAKANELLAERRKLTKDVFMTAFKGLRQDGRYRRRLDFSQARDLLNLALELVGGAA